MHAYAYIHKYTNTYTYVDIHIFHIFIRIETKLVIDFVNVFTFHTKNHDLGS